MSYDPAFLLQHLSQKQIERSPDHWWVTTSVIQYFVLPVLIERSPDHWWVTTAQKHRNTPEHILKGHQIIGELRPKELSKKTYCSNWKVTRSLVSYDAFKLSDITLQRIERSPDHWWVTTSNVTIAFLWFRLKGHQIIGELRPRYAFSRAAATRLKGHQIIGELRPHSITKILIQTSNWKVTRSLVSYDTTKF